MRVARTVVPIVAVVAFGASVLAMPFAADAAGSATVVTTATELQTALASGDSVVLGDDIIAGDETFTVPADATTTIDLAGFTMYARMLDTGTGADITITDTAATPGLAVFSNSDDGGPGIRSTGSRVTITGNAHVSARGSSGAGIGGGFDLSQGSPGTHDDNGAVVVSGDAHVNAYGSGSGAGLGAAFSGAGGTIDILDDAVVIAEGDPVWGQSNGPGIGSGSGGTAAVVTIGGAADVTATGGAQSPGIGTAMFWGQIGASSTVRIDGTATVHATGGPTRSSGSHEVGAPGIGGGWFSYGSDVTIGGSAHVIAVATGASAAIGGGDGIVPGHASLNGSLTIRDDAVVEATAGGQGLAGSATSLPGAIGWSAFMANDDRTPPAGPLTLDGGTLLVHGSTPLAIPHDLTVTNAGTIWTEAGITGATGPDEGVIAAGAIVNDGTIVAGGAVAPTITHHAYAITWDAAGGTLAAGTAPTTRVYAATLGAAQVALPSATRAGHWLSGWTLDGEPVTESSTLPGSSADGAPVPLTLTAVWKALVPTTTTVSLAPPSVAYGSRSLATVRVAVPSGAEAATGTVVIKSGATVLGTKTLASGSTTLWLPNTWGVGPHTVQAFYSGDAHHSASAKSAVLHVVKATPTVRVTASAFRKGAHPTVAVTVAKLLNGVQPQGRATIFVDGKGVKTIGITSSGRATATLPDAYRSSISVKAQFLGGTSTSVRTSPSITVRAL